MVTTRRFVLLMLALLGMPAGGQPVSEYELKAAFVYNFVQFTDWPAEARMEASPVITLCVSASSPLSSALYALNDRQVRGKRMEVRFMAAMEMLPRCHVLFLDAVDKRHLVQIRKALGNASVLTISDDRDIIREGVVIGMALLPGNRVGFEINLQAMKRARLTISSKLLRLSRSVR